MKNLMLGTAMVVALAVPAAGQDLFRAEMGPLAITTSDLIGKRVYAAEGATEGTEYAGVQSGWNDIGEINDVVLTRDGKVDAVLVDIGGFLGMGERQVALGMESLRFVADSATPEDLNDYFLVITADRAVLEGAPDYQRSVALPSAVPADPMADGIRTVDGYASVEASAVRGDQLIGARVYGPGDENLGEISEVRVDEQAMTSTVIVDVGGFLGLGEKPVALDVSRLQILKETAGDALIAYVQMTQEELEALPSAAP